MTHIDLAGTRLVKLVISAVCNQDRDGDVYERRGAAIVATIQAIELNGYTCELWANYDAHDRRTGADIHLAIKLKSYGDALDLDRVAFALSHPAHFRRLVFAQLEKMTDTPCGPLSSRDAADKGDVYVGLTECVYHTDQDAAEWAKRKIAELQTKA